MRQALFWSGSLLVMLGVAMHIPMVLDAHAMGMNLAQMPSDPSMWAGMTLMLLGFGLASFALLRRAAAPAIGPVSFFEPATDQPLGRWHVSVLGVLVLGLMIDVMKPATLGFVLPGLAAEYSMPKSSAALLPFVALVGTTVGSFAWGCLADRRGRRTSILLSTLLFVATSVCGAMPTFGLNLVMCFVMGASAGGMLPVVYTLLAELMPARQRGWLLVFVGGIGLVGGYLAASASAHLLEPLFGWRVLWLQGFPTGILLLALSRFIPESPAFLAQEGRSEDLQLLCARFGLVEIAAKASQRAVDLGDVNAETDHARAQAEPEATQQAYAQIKSAYPPLAGADASKQVDARANAAGKGRGHGGEDDHLWSLLTLALVLAALCWSFVNFGLLLWLPSELQAKGLGIELATSVLARSALIALPTVALAAFLYARWSGKGTLIGTVVLTVLGLFGALLPPTILRDPTILIAVVATLIIGSNGMIAVLLPYASESYPLRSRARGTGFVAAGSKFGGVAVQGGALAGFIPTFAGTSMLLLVPMLVAGVLILASGREMSGHALGELEVD